MEVAVGMFNWRLLEMVLMGSSENKTAAAEAVILTYGHIKIIACLPEYREHWPHLLQGLQF